MPMPPEPAVRSMARSIRAACRSCASINCQMTSVSRPTRARCRRE
jgi:hypothetical protein